METIDLRGLRILFTQEAMKKNENTEKQKTLNKPDTVQSGHKRAKK